MLYLIVVLQVIIGIAIPAVALYFSERIKNVAREASEKTLADYRHHHEQELAAINAEHQRLVQEARLYAQEQHRAYARLYRLLRKTEVLYDDLIGLTTAPDFSKYDAEAIREYARQHKLREQDIAPMLAALANGDSARAGQLIAELHRRIMAWRADASFERAKYFGALYEPYLSERVQACLAVVRDKMASVSVSLMPDMEVRAREQLQQEQEMKRAVSDLLAALRSEMRRGFSDSFSPAHAEAAPNGA